MSTQQGWRPGQLINALTTLVQNIANNAQDILSTQLMFAKSPAEAEADYIKGVAEFLGVEPSQINIEKANQWYTRYGEALTTPGTKITPPSESNVEEYLKEQTVANTLDNMRPLNRINRKSRMYGQQVDVEEYNDGFINHYIVTKKYV